MKDLNKWWDGYSGEAIVCIDEFQPCHAEYLTSYLKKWVDRWPFSAEIKGGKAGVIRPSWIIVTSNHPLDNCFHGVDLDALRSRFCVVEKVGKEDNVCLRSLLNLVIA